MPVRAAGRGNGCRGRIDPRRPALATHPTAGAVAEAALQMRELHDAAAVVRSHPAYAAPAARTEAVLALLRSGRYPMVTLPRDDQ